ncbi:MAG: phosphoglycerate dehydrogenase [Bacteroidetes bacterium]|nr:phosphoglycerate dehydrogenase [Bacteroidota bacterium]
MQELDRAGIPFVYEPEISVEQIENYLENGIGGIVIRSKMHMDQRRIELGASLRLIARGGAGMDNVDEEFAKSKNIICVNAGEANSDAVGEHAIGMLLGLFHKIRKGDAEVRNKIWDREGNRGLELKGKTVGIIGFGNTGSAVAKKLSGFEVNILAYDKFKSGFGNAYVRETNLANIFESADILTIHIPLDSHTKLMVNSEFIHSFVRNIFLLNLSRGGIVKTKDVLDAMKTGKILGFAADVLEHENPRGMGDTERAWFEELIARDDVLLTPHVAGWTKESYEKISAVLAQKICAEWPRL